MKKLIYFLGSIIGLCCLACATSLTQETLAGKWQVTDMQTDMQGKVPDVLIKNAKTISLATRYEFTANLSFKIEILKNELENASKYIGRMTLITQDRSLCLKPDSVFFKNNEGQWKFSSDKFLYTPQQMKIKKITADKLILSIKDKSGRIDYTLRKIQ